MRRRSVLGLGLTVGIGAATGMRRFVRAPTERWSFFVAGVRYQTVVDVPTTNAVVHLERQTWHGETCLEVRTAAGVRLGYVPRAMLRRLHWSDIVEARLSLVDPHAVPWKRYAVTVVARGWHEA